MRLKIMIKVITATGKEFPSDYLVTIPSPDMLFVRLLDTERETAESVFQNPEETSVLVYGGDRYEGYTGFRSIFDEGDALKVGLERCNQ